MSPDTPYTALLYVSFGGPESPDEVLPFLEHVVAGRGVPQERLLAVAEHYHDNGGRSPINDQNRDMIAALATDFDEAGLDLPIYFGNRNSAPWLADTLAEMAADGHGRVLAYVTSAFSSYSGCRQYRENIADALREADVEVTVDKVRVFYNHPGFIAAQADRVRDAIDLLAEDVRGQARLLFVTHSIPLTMARHSDYEVQHLEASRLVAASVDPSLEWELVFCSRSGPPHVPWLEPDVGDRIQSLSIGEARAVVVVPIGFVSDHMEVIHDLDVEAAAVAAGRGVPFVRAGTVGTHPTFVRGVRALVEERQRGTEHQHVGRRSPNHDECPMDCCRVPGSPERPSVASSQPPRPRA